MTEERVSSRYASALFDAAEKENIIEIVMNDVLLIRDYLKTSRELFLLIKSPVVYHWQKKNIFKELFESKIQAMTLNFLLLVADKKREFLLWDILAAFEKLYNYKTGKINAEITTAVELNDLLKTSVVSKLTEKTNKHVLSSFDVDPSLKGGVKIRIEDTVYDSSLANQLRLLKKSLIEG